MLRIDPNNGLFIDKAGAFSPNRPHLSGIQVPMTCNMLKVNCSNS